MTNLLAPKVDPKIRRGSWEPSTQPIYFDEQYRRHSVQLSSNGTSGGASPLERFRRSITKIDAAKFFKVKPYNSDESLVNDGKDYSSQKSLNGSTNSLKTSPLMSRNELDKCDFIIPKSPNSFQKQMFIHKEQANLGVLDITQYLSNDEARELKELGPSIKLGEVKFCLAYNESIEKLKIILKSAEVNLKPSSAVVGCNWACEPIVYVDILPDKKKASEICLGLETMIDMKKSDYKEKTVRLSIYDSRRKSLKLPIGHALLPLRDVASSEKYNIYSKKINFYSQPAGFNKGTISISLAWGSSAKKLEVKIGQASNLKSPHGVDGKDHFVKMTVYISGSKQKSYKTTTIKANPELNFREKFTLPVNTSQLRDCTLVFNLYMKHTSKKMIVNKILTGRTVIGPYMTHGERSLSQWEKMLTNPPDEVTETHTLYL